MDAATLDELVKIRIRLRTHLSTKTGNPPKERIEHELRRLMCCVADVTIDIGKDLRGVMRGYNGTSNTFGENQIKLDVLADHRLMKNLEQEESFQVRQLASEESDEIRILSSRDGRYSVTFDPLDGSSVVDANFSVGTIVGFYDGDLLDGKPGRVSLAGAMYVMFGPATTLVYAVPGGGAHEFVLDEGRFFLERENLQMAMNGQIYGPGANINKWLPEHQEFIKAIQNKGHHLRYSGAFVSDVNHIFVKGGGIFSNPALTDTPNGKLRLLFELQPLALIAEEMNGAATNGTIPILDLIPRELGERSPVYIGSKHEVELAKQYLTGAK